MVATTNYVASNPDEVESIKTLARIKEEYDFEDGIFVWGDILV